jgi:transposase
MAQGGHLVTPVVLTDAERQVLQQWAQQSNEPLARRAKIVLECAAGSSPADAATKLGVTTKTVQRWKRKFLEQRLEGLSNRVHPKQQSVTSGTTGKTKRSLRKAFV